MIKVLHMFTTLDNGGVESFLFNYYSHMNLNEIQFDFIVPGEKKGFMEDDLIKMNSNIYHINSFKSSPWRQFREICKIIKNGNYDVVHCHGYKSFIGILAAKKMKVKGRILHSHMAFVQENLFQRFVRKFIVFLANFLCTNELACGDDAAKWLFGEKRFNSGKVKVINNAIDIDKYKYNLDARDRIRSELRIDKDTVLLGDVARLSYQKNQVFLLNLIKLMNSNEKKYKLVLVGNGEDEQMLKDKCSEYNISDSVIFLGIRNDIPDILCALDFFLLPSHYEGLPVVLAEVQASGLNCIVSDNVTRELKIVDNLVYASIDNSLDEWHNKIISMSNDNVDRVGIAKKMINSKYDIRFQCEHLLDIYKKYN